MTNKDIKNAYIGTTEVKAMYLGSTKVWPVETLSRPQIGDFCVWRQNMVDYFR